MIELNFLVYNRLNVVMRCLASLWPTIKNRSDLVVTVWDNASQANTTKWLLAIAENYPIKVVFSTENLGVCGGRQAVLERSEADILCFLDSDVEFAAENWLDKLLEPLKEPTIAASGCGGHFLNPDWKSYRKAKNIGPVDVISGYCQAVKRDALDGFSFDPFFYPYWHEDSDMCLWLKDKGFTIWHTGNIGIRHNYAGSGDDGLGGIKQAYLAEKWKDKVTLGV